MILIDEAWKALDDDVFVAPRSRIGKRRSASATGWSASPPKAPQDALDSPIASAIVEQTATPIFMPNPKAQARNISTASASPSTSSSWSAPCPTRAHCFLVKHGNDSVVARLDLTGEKRPADGPVGPRAHGSPARRNPARDRRRSGRRGCRACWRLRDGRLLSVSRKPPASSVRRRATSTARPSSSDRARGRRWLRRARRSPSCSPAS